MRYIRDNKAYKVKTVTFKFNQARIDQETGKFGYEDYKVVDPIDEAIKNYFTDQDYILDTQLTASDKYVYVQVWYHHYTQSEIDAANRARMKKEQSEN